MPHVHDRGMIALPRKLTVDDEYKGYHLPAGAVVWGNAWYVVVRIRLQLYMSILTSRYQGRPPRRAHLFRTQYFQAESLFER